MMFKSKLKLGSLVLCLVFIISCFGGSMYAQGASTAELRDRKDKIQNEIDAAQSKIDALAAEKSETQEYLNALTAKISLLQDKINTLNSQKASLQAEIDAIQKSIDKTEEELRINQAEIDKKQAEFDENYELYCQRLRAMYVSGSVSNLEVLLTCPDMSAMLTRSQMIKSVSEQDSEQLDDLMKKMEEIEAKKQELEIKRNELNQDKQKLEENKKTLQSSIDEINKSKSELDSQAASANALMRKLSAQSSEYLELIETNQEELQAVEDEIRRALYSSNNNSNNVQGTGQLGYPTDSRSVSAGFPNYSSGRYHGGIDFQVPTGSNIYAADSGTVALVKYLNYSYGYYIIINHGNGLSTLYAHNSQLLVSPGQAVSKGQVIAKSGSTGNSSGPHCHFEVRVDGNRVNPWNYL